MARTTFVTNSKYKKSSKGKSVRNTQHKNSRFVADHLEIPISVCHELDPIIARQGEILKQLQYCDMVISREDKSSHLSKAATSWRSQLASMLEQAQPIFWKAGNIDRIANPKERVKDFWSLLGTVTDDLDETGDKDLIKRFLLAVAWHEGASLTARIQENGPARSFFQFEAHRAKDACNYAIQRTWLGKLVAVSGKTEKVIRDAISGLPDYDSNHPGTSAQFPDKNAIEECLRTNDLFGAYLARIAFKKVTEGIQPGCAAHAEYWYKYWKVTGGDPETLKKMFRTKCVEVNGLIPQPPPLTC